MRVAHEQVQYLGPDGKLITESLRDFTRIQLNQRYASLDGFLQAWHAAERKEAILAELEKQGVLFEELAEMAGKELDPFDLICHIAFNQPPLTRRERAERVRKRNVFGQYGDTARRVLQALLDKYADAGITNIEQIEVLKLAPLNEFGSPVEIITAFGGKAKYQAALQELERALYQ